MNNSGEYERTMSTIAICDDQSASAQKLYRILQSIQAGWDTDWNIVIYDSGEDLLRHITDIDIVFLDIEMPGIDGIETGKRIRALHPECCIIMETAFIERFKEAFMIQAFRFVTKPFQTDEIKEALRAALQSRLDSGHIEVYLNRNKYQIKQRNIQYIEAFNGYIICLSQNQLFRKDVTLSQMEAQLDSPKMKRISKKFIVNMDWIDDYNNGTITIGNKQFIVPRRNRKQFEKDYIEYDLQFKRR